MTTTPQHLTLRELEQRGGAAHLIGILDPSRQDMEAARIDAYKDGIDTLSVLLDRLEGVLDDNHEAAYDLRNDIRAVVHEFRGEEAT